MSPLVAAGDGSAGPRKPTGTVHRDGDFGAAQMAILGRRLRVTFLALYVHWGGCERSPAALPRWAERGACAGSGRRAAERSTGRLVRLESLRQRYAYGRARQSGAVYGGVLYVGAKW